MSKTERIGLGLMIFGLALTNVSEGWYSIVTSFAFLGIGFGLLIS